MSFLHGFLLGLGSICLSMLIVTTFWFLKIISIGIIVPFGKT